MGSCKVGGNRLTCINCEITVNNLTSDYTGFTGLTVQSHWNGPCVNVNVYFFASECGSGPLRSAYCQPGWQLLAELKSKLRAV